MTSRECYGNKWFYMKYIGKYFSMEILKLLLTCVCTNDADLLSKVVLVIGMICTIINALKKTAGLS
jgi:branched-subunit amino acid transport protein AzlD